MQGRALEYVRGFDPEDWSRPHATSVRHIEVRPIQVQGISHAHHLVARSAARLPAGLVQAKVGSVLVPVVAQNEERGDLLQHDVW